MKASLESAHTFRNCVTQCDMLMCMGSGHMYLHKYSDGNKCCRGSDDKAHPRPDM